MHWYEAHGVGKRRLKISVFWTEIMRVQQSAGSFALCIEDGGMEDLEARKVYQVLPDREASREGYVRVIDESGEVYMYPSDLFVPVRLPAAVARQLRGAIQTKIRTRLPSAARRNLQSWGAEWACPDQSFAWHDCVSG
jgi:hypothetical protein